MRKIQALVAKLLKVPSDKKLHERLDELVADIYGLTEPERELIGMRT